MNPIHNRRSGFTLIELLVVIAIIAILAAILFPVFAQAKDAAKKTQSISNMKQVLIAHQMYSDDADDMFCPRWRVGWGPPNGGDPTPAMSWDKLVQPYAKNGHIFMSPADPNPKYETTIGIWRRSYGVPSNPFQSTQDRGNSERKPSKTRGSIIQPADTIALGERRMCPRSYVKDPWIRTDWLNCAEISNTRALEEQYGEISYSHTAGANWGFVDSHAKYYRKGGKRRTDNKLVGTLFPGYEQKGYSEASGNDPYWDTGISCLDSGWEVGKPDCALPGEKDQ